MDKITDKLRLDWLDSNADICTINGCKCLNKMGMNLREEIDKMQRMKIKTHCESTTHDSWIAWLDHSGHDEKTCPFDEYDRHVNTDGLKIGIGSCAHQVQCFHAGFIRG